MLQNCYHCGQNCDSSPILFDKKLFCCTGCKSVYEILNINNLSNFYALNKVPGIRPEELSTDFSYLDTPEVFEKVVDFSEQGTSVVTFYVPVIHCSSCVWLLESLSDINPNIIYSQTNFAKKSLQITFKNKLLPLSELAQFITNLGYQPKITLDNLEKKEITNNKILISKIAIAGFCFGNVMFFALPEYLENSAIGLEKFKYFFRWIMFFLSLPVVFYCSTDYFKSAWSGIKNRFINIDIPISIGILVLFLRSCYEFYMDISAGYFDSLCGLLFFMLIGKYFQQRTYQAMAFDRDYKSFYPISVVKIEEGKEENVLLSGVKKGDRIRVRNGEIIPADCVLIEGEAFIDNSFITGESHLIAKKSGDKVYAGAKQCGKSIVLETISEVNQSYLTELWNHQSFKKKSIGFTGITNAVSQYFTTIILFITLIAAIYWYFIDIKQMFQVVCAILIVACPCALSLSAPFSLGNLMRLLGMKGFYVKDALTLEKIGKITHIVFDKTGTLTENSQMDFSYAGIELLPEDKKIIKSMAKNSNHLMSKTLYESDKESPIAQLDHWEEVVGKGMVAVYQNQNIRLGSSNWILPNSKTENNKTKVVYEKNGIVVGQFVFCNHYRKGINEMIKTLGAKYHLSLLSGDSDAEKEKLTTLFSLNHPIYFNQNPQEKLNYIEKLQNEKKETVMMIGDGLNDAGALFVSDVGIAIAENSNSFSPSCDVIMRANLLSSLDKIIVKVKQTKRIIWTSLGISLFYNIIGLSFAITGNLDPLVAAILMPISSISVVSFTTIATRLLFYNSMDFK
jgi:P-type Cu+ transporter